MLYWPDQWSAEPGKGQQWVVMGLRNEYRTFPEGPVCPPSFWQADV